MCNNNVHIVYLTPNGLFLVQDLSVTTLPQKIKARCDMLSYQQKLSLQQSFCRGANIKTAIILICSCFIWAYCWFSSVFFPHFCSSFQGWWCLHFRWTWIIFSLSFTSPANRDQSPSVCCRRHRCCCFSSHRTVVNLKRGSVHHASVGKQPALEPWRTEFQL